MVSGGGEGGWRREPKRGEGRRGAGCGDVVDLGETSYSMVLADDLNGDGRTDLVVTTMNGNVYAFQTPARHHPLASWTAQVHARALPPPGATLLIAAPLSRLGCIPTAGAAGAHASLDDHYGREMQRGIMRVWRLLRGN